MKLGLPLKILDSTRRLATWRRWLEWHFMVRVGLTPSILTTLP